MRINAGTYDVEFDIHNASIDDLSLKLMSVNVSSNMQNILDSVAANETNKLSFKIDITGQQKVQVYGGIKPSKVWLGTMQLAEASSLVALEAYTWYYDAIEKTLHLIANV